MNNYIESGINILNDVTKDLENLNSLAIYLAKQTDINALKSLKLLILASENKLLKKDFDINFVKDSKTTFLNETHYQKENIIGNLSFNPQYLGLLLMEFIIHNYKIDLNIEPYGSPYTYFDFWLRSFERIENDQDIFYKRYDMIDKKLDMIDFMIKCNILDHIEISSLLATLNHCLENKYNYTNAQLFKMQNIYTNLKLKDQFINNSPYLMNNLVNKHHDLVKIIDELTNLSSDTKYHHSFTNQERCESMRNELQNLSLRNDQCNYMLREIPLLTKKKIIK